ncbi:MAG: DUF4924 family protein [Crocinitomicaceae bacterium]
MLIAQQKKDQNIAEYIVYMYQIEDIIRAFKLDVDAIMNNFVLPQLPDRSFETQYRNWYEGLVKQMKIQKIEEKGHLAELNEIIVELSYLHQTLLNMAKDEKYAGIFERALPLMEDFKSRSNLKEKNHIEIAFHAMYMKLLMKLQKKEISAETEDAFDSMRMLLAYLGRSYHKMKSGDLDFLQN